MLIQDVVTQTLVDMDPVLAREFIAKGLAKAAERRIPEGTGPSQGQVMDSNTVVVAVPSS